MNAFEVLKALIAEFGLEAVVATLSSICAANGKTGSDAAGDWRVASYDLDIAVARIRTLHQAVR